MDIFLQIDAGEFEEALHLAEVYDLDSDRVYQSQWRNSPVSEETISAYLVTSFTLNSKLQYHK